MRQVAAAVVLVQALRQVVMVLQILAVAVVVAHQVLQAVTAVAVS